LAIWNNVIKEYSNNYASAIRHNIFILNQITILYFNENKNRNGLNAASDMIIHLFSIKPNIKKVALRKGNSTVHINKTSRC